jgi:hypothetical protein
VATNTARHPGTPARCGRALALLLAVLVTLPAYAQSPDTAAPVLTAFDNQLQDYARMHRRLERHIGTIEFSTPVAEINRIIQQLAAAIRAERTGARRGDLFTPELGRLLRSRINDALLEHGLTADDVRRDGAVEAVDYDRVRLRVNDTFPWILASAMFPCVLETLPPLPPELQYRIVGDDLMLIDTHASLIVDILPAALIDLTAPAQGPQGGLR